MMSEVSITSDRSHKALQPNKEVAAIVDAENDSLGSDNDSCDS